MTSNEPAVTADLARRETREWLEDRVATEPERTRAAVVNALRDRGAHYQKRANQASDENNRAYFGDLAAAFFSHADAIENGADL